MSKEKIRYFIAQNKTGAHLPQIIWDSKLNAVMCQAHPAGIYITKLEPVVEVLTAMGYVEVDADYCTGLHIEEPLPDRVDYTVRDNPRYIKFQ